MLPLSHTLKEVSHGILSYFEHRQNYCSIEGNLKIILYKDRKGGEEGDYNKA